MSPSQTRDILLHSFETAAIPAALKYNAVMIPSAANHQMDRVDTTSIFRTTRK